MNGGLSDAWIEGSLERLKDKLGIYGSGMNRAQAWRDAIGPVDPETFYKTLTRDLPGQTNIMIEATGGGVSELNLTCRQGRATLLQVENKIHRHPVQSKIHFEEWRVGNQDPSHSNRGQGLGTILFANQLELMKPLGLRSITLRAGREDGPVYWARRGFCVEENGPYLNHFIQAVRENYNALQSQIKPETRIEIEKILTNPASDANVRIALINDEIDGKKLRQRLMLGTNPRCVVDTENPAQMSRVHDSLKNIDTIRQQVRASFPAETPVTPQGLPKPSVAFDFKH